MEALDTIYFGYLLNKKYKRRTCRDIRPKKNIKSLCLQPYVVAICCDLC